MTQSSHILKDPRDLLAALLARKWRVIAPVIRDRAVKLDVLTHPEQLPYGWQDEQSPGRYRLSERGTGRWFDYCVGPESWKAWLHPAKRKLWSARKTPDGFEIDPETEAWPPTVFFGVWACDLAAIGIQAAVFGASGAGDYERRRAATRIVAVNCTRSVDTCFCASAGTGPHAQSGYDLALTELPSRLLLEVGSEGGAELLDGIDLAPAMPADLQAARSLSDRAAGQQRRGLPEGIESALATAQESPHWSRIAERCLSCANCTMVCPTCFCTDTFDRTDLGGDHAERWQRWDSCFSPDFSYLHGGSVRRSGASRYRQWMTHKLSYWHAQFGTSGCTGCGRCIAWCPVGIDLTAEAAAIAGEE